MPRKDDLSGRRQDRRLRVTMPVELQNGNGITRDVSVSGVFFETDLSISAGTGIIFSMILEHVDPAGPIRLHCHGEVVRVERVHDKFGVAVAIDQHRFDSIEAFSLARLPWVAPDRAC